MLNFIDLFQKNKPKGVVHCGAQLFNIRSIYVAQNLFNTIWIENQEFFYEYGKTLITESEKIFNYNFNQNNTISSLFKSNNLNFNDYDYIQISLSSYINCGLDPLKNDIHNFKFVCIEVTNNIENLPTDIDVVKKWFTSNRYKLISLESIDNLSYLFFIRKRKYNRRLIELIKS